MLSKTRRLEREKIEEVFKKGVRFDTPFIYIKFLPKGKPADDKKTQFTVVVGAKVSKKAVVRNKLKRRVRSVIEENLELLKEGFEVIFFVKPGPEIKDAKFSDIEKSVLYLLRQSNLLTK